jgi:hypothetical protein
MKSRGAWGAGAALAAVAAVLIGASWHRRWGATPAEAAGPLPGDDLISQPVFQSTRAITIEAAPQAVWPWLVQMGMGRGGWYSYDWWLGKLSITPAVSAAAIIEDLQDLKVGDAVDLIDKMVFRVQDLRPNRALVLHADEHQIPLQPWVKSWAFVLEPLEGGATRLIVRERSAWDHKWIGFLTAFTNWLWFVANRRQLKNLKALAEAA